MNFVEGLSFILIFTIIILLLYRVEIFLYVILYLSQKRNRLLDKFKPILDIIRRILFATFFIPLILFPIIFIATYFNKTIYHPFIILFNITEFINGYMVLGLTIILGIIVYIYEKSNKTKRKEYKYFLYSFEIILFITSFVMFSVNSLNIRKSNYNELEIKSDYCIEYKIKIDLLSINYDGKIFYYENPNLVIRILENEGYTNENIKEGYFYLTKENSKLIVFDNYVVNLNESQEKDN